MQAIRNLMTKKHQGISTMDLSIYIVIASFLLLVGLYQYGPFSERARRHTTREDMRTIVQAILTYEADSSTGSLPSNLGALITGLTSSETVDGIARSSYVTKSTWTSDSSTFVDGWGNAFVYDSSGRTLTSTNNKGTSIVLSF
jgi:Bacterial type II secretion system protein G.